MTRQFKKQVQNQSQSGRSMIEMLGVLAIIAILSIGGIVGFRLAMNYYQANQIAHEMNIMRTDAQIKIAQGAEELMLGDPYDSGNIQFNGYKTDFDCLYMETETSTPDDVASCAVANAYYIEMQKIPEGICKPLANLIDKMDNEIAFYINGKSVDAAEGEKGACGEGINTLKVIFGADSDSKAIKCDTDAECESLENTPFCDTGHHVCVECTQEKGCEEKSQYCKENTCITCESGVWNGKDCVECTTSADCENPTPICSEENTCVGCETSDECRLKNPSEANCTENGACCADSLMTWNGNECVCPENKPWNGEFCGCRDNDDCTSDKFCISVSCERLCTDRHQSIRVTENCDIKKCVSISSYTQQNQDSTGSYVISSQEMNWWSAKRFCEAQEHKKNMLRISELECQNTIGYYDGREGNEERGQCMSRENSNEVSHIIKALRKARFGNETQTADEWYWLKDAYAENKERDDSCNVYQVHLDGNVFFGDFRFNSGYALCES